MEKIKLRVSGNQIEVVERPPVITAGTVGLAAEFAFDSQWKGLTKTAVFRTGDKVIATILEGNTHTVPWEVLEKPDLWLDIGVYGANSVGTVVIPTLWAKVAVIHTGVDPKGDPGLEPSNPIWQETLNRVDDITLEIDDHIYNRGEYNPHKVTCAQIGAAPVEECDAFRHDVIDHINSVEDDLADHSDRRDNPHKVTASQVGSVSQEDLPDIIADILDEEYKHGGNVFEVLYLIIERAMMNNGVLAYIEELDEYVYHAWDYNNPHSVTCEQIGAVRTKEYNNFREDTVIELNDITNRISSVEASVGDIETVLDSILALQNDLIGGDGV